METVEERKYKSADWSQFREYTENRLEKLRSILMKEDFTIPDLHNVADTFDRVVRAGLDRVAPKIKVKEEDKIKSWWNEKCNELAEEAENTENILAKAQIKTELKNEIKKAKRETFQRFVSETNTTEEALKVAKIAKSSKGIDNPALRKKMESLRRTGENLWRH